MYKIVIVTKCRAEDCTVTDVFYNRRRGDPPLYCIRHAIEYGLVHVKTGRKPKGICDNGNCKNKKLITLHYSGREEKYCQDYTIIDYHNSIHPHSKYSKCSDVMYLQCMYTSLCSSFPPSSVTSFPPSSVTSACSNIPQYMIYDKNYEGYYCYAHYHSIQRLLNCNSPSPTDYSQYLPTDDDWIEYALEAISNTAY